MERNQVLKEDKIKIQHQIGGKTFTTLSCEVSLVRLPASTLQSTSRWHELPPELLQMIFGHLRNRDKPKDEGKSKLLSCRLVHSHWKDSADYVLQRKSLNLWEWKPSSFPASSPTFPTLKLVENPPANGWVGSKWALCSRKIFSNHESPYCPVPPTSSLRLFGGSKHGGRMKSKESIIPMMDLFPKWAQNLVSLEFVNITILQGELRAMFQPMVNLKALTLSEIVLQYQCRSFDQPMGSLPKLVNYKLFSVRDKSGISNFGYKWLLQTFTQQLISLETDEQLYNFLENEGFSSFPKLKQLTVVEKRSQMLQTQPLFPELEQVCLVLSLELNITIWEELKRVCKFLESSSTTLNLLHLEFKEWTRFRIDRLQLHELGYEFPKLTTLGMFYPMIEGEKAVLRKFLKVAPNLETLKLFRFIKGSERSNHQELMHGSLDTEKLSYRKAFPTLETLTTYLDWRETSKYYTLEM